ncbi:MAG TPA: MMPL family transporter [Mycobacteriales bacterium]|nr:MMPL family transporter [Mycobacteriales bacterium]
MLARLAPVLVARRRLVMVLAALFLVLAGGLGGGVAKELSAGGFVDPEQESERAAVQLDRQFGTGSSNFLLLAATPGGADRYDAAGKALTARVAAEDGVADVVSYWTAGHEPTMAARDKSSAVVLVRVLGSQDAQVEKAKELGRKYNGTITGLKVRTGGEFSVYAEVGPTIERDVVRAELIAFPVVTVLLILVFGSAIAAALPLLIGVISILGTFLALHVVNGMTDVSIYAVNLATSLGLGLGIDYALFLVSRFREEIRKDLPVPQAVAETMRTAGRTVLFSAVTVALSLGSLLVFPLYFLRSFAYAGISAVLFALFGALVVLPAVLAALGPKVDALDLRRPLRWFLGLGSAKPRVKSIDEGAWHRIALAVMRRPLGIAALVVAILVLAGLPFRAVSFSLPDDRVLPREARSQQVAQVLREDYPGREAQALPVVLGASTDTGEYASRLSSVEGVARVDASEGRFVDGLKVAPGVTGFRTASATRLSVVPDFDAYGAEGERLVERVRDVGAPAPALVSGQAAALHDTKSALGSALPLALGILLLPTFVLLFLFTGSVVVPLKAIVMNVLSLSATFGLMVWVFQEGHLASWVGDPIITGALDTTTPILMFCILFGLSMDYEVFLLSRIKEEWDATGDNTRAVAVGLERTGSLVTAAAGLLAMVFLAFVSSDIAFIKLLGLGTAVAVLVDATLIRGALVPAFMRLMGHRNWWAPRPLRALHDRFGLAEAHAALPTEAVGD